MSFPLLSGILKRSQKTFTYNGSTNGLTSGPDTLFTVSGQVFIRYLVIYVQATLTGTSATMALGIAGNTSGIISPTTATTLIAGDFWESTSPATVGSALKDILVASNIILTYATANVTGGVLYVDAYWHPLGTLGSNIT